MFLSLYFDLSLSTDLSFNSVRFLLLVDKEIYCLYTYVYFIYEIEVDVFQQSSVVLYLFFVIYFFKLKQHIFNNFLLILYFLFYVFSLIFIPTCAFKHLLPCLINWTTQPDFKTHSFQNQTMLNLS